ncbi:Oidioi.mRNA.OKI2018_I69.chr1.g3893.t1.cds [Oikopleura dioica]|uniref:Oidioi.mRNA.OKI2018_I69.chr1.g3893.t1.cds n=1 Tax=Oikopleura dioica TaxID=34765 RepID=A0ABN7T141_OIKDI|nr:Oidioi.mRNA.OKI2018_I69.chr1.g3893.t1.cds [Oikopleura dioica]
MIEEIVQIARERKDSEDLPAQENKFEALLAEKAAVVPDTNSLAINRKVAPAQEIEREQESTKKNTDNSAADKSSSSTGESENDAFKFYLAASFFGALALGTVLYLKTQ